MCVEVQLKLLQGTWQMWVQYWGTEGRLARRFSGVRDLKVPLPLPVNSTEENQSFQHSPTFFSGLGTGVGEVLSQLCCCQEARSTSHPSSNAEHPPQ